MSVAIAIASLWVAFGATHLVLSSRAARPKLIARLGAQGFQGVYSLLALAIFVPLVWIYFDNQHAGPFLWYLGANPGMRWVGYVGMATALTLLIGGLLRPSPASMTAGGRTPEASVAGVLRITRHPVVMSMGLFGAVHLLIANVNAAELAFFGGFPIWAGVGCRHQDQRKLDADPDTYGPFVERTAFWPFTRGGLFPAAREAVVAVGLAVVLAFVIRYFHAGWFGGAP